MHSLTRSGGRLGTRILPRTKPGHGSQCHPTSSGGAAQAQAGLLWAQQALREACSCSREVLSDVFGLNLTKILSEVAAISANPPKLNVL